MATTIGKFDTVTSVFAGVNDIIVGDVAADSAYASGTLDTLFANAKSVGQVKEDSTNWTGDDPTVDSVKDERGNIITTKTTAGTFAFEFLMASMSENILKAFMKASDVSSVVGQLRWKEHIKKHKRFLIFLIDISYFIFLSKIRNNDRTIEYII